MEFPADPSRVDQAWKEQDGSKLIKSHEWIDHVDQLPKEDWKILVYRPDQTSFAWWHEAGGFQIGYPDYSAYKNSANMLAEIIRTNQLILEYGFTHNAKWEYFTSEWIQKHFNTNMKVEQTFPDILVTVIK